MSAGSLSKSEEAVYAGALDSIVSRANIETYARYLEGKVDQLSDTKSRIFGSTFDAMYSRQFEAYTDALNNLYELFPHLKEIRQKTLSARCQIALQLQECIDLEARNDAPRIDCTEEPTD